MPTIGPARTSRLICSPGSAILLHRSPLSGAFVEALDVMESSLGPQCWGCRWRRVRCDSQQPACSKCSQKGLECPGYSATKPLRWRHRITRNKQSSPKLPNPTPATAKTDVAPLHVITDALTYYNTKVAPDLAADGSSSPYIIKIADWHEFSISKRHLTLCLVMLHRTVLESGDVKQNQALFHYHQACAAEILNHRIKTLGHLGPGQKLFEDVSLFFFSQIQASAYGAWRAHLNAAKTLFNLWGVETLMGSSDYEFSLCHLVLADIFGAAMAPASHITAEDVEQHKVYLGLLGRFNVDVCSTMVPIPEAIVRNVASINISRARKLPDVHSEQRQVEDPASTDATLDSLRVFDPTDWALHRPRHTSSQATSWALLATCFQAAAVLYLIRTSYTSTYEDAAAFFYGRLTKCIRELYELRQEGGTLYKYVLWPMVVCGVEAVLRSDEQQTKSLCGLLEQTTMDLGTLSMREAAVFLNELWLAGLRKDLEPNRPHMAWDEIFHLAPLFLM